MTGLRRHPVRCLILVAIAATVWVGSAVTAEATCGDYLEHLPASRGVDRAAGQPLPQAVISPETLARDSHAPSDEPCECRSGSCSRGPRLPARAPTRTSSFGEHWAWMNAGFAPPAVESHAHFAEVASPLPRGAGLDILRPPR